MNRRRLAGYIGGAAALFGIGAFAVSTAFGSGNKAISANEMSKLSQITHLQKIAVHLPTSRRTTIMRQRGYTTVFRIGTSNGRNLFQISRNPATTCYGAGAAGSRNPVGVITCPLTGFPSAAHPVVDLSIIGADRANPTLHFISIAGVAADGVVSIDAVDASGQVVDSLPVANNLFSSGATNLGTTVVRYEAVDSSGTVVASFPRA